MQNFYNKNFFYPKPKTPQTPLGYAQGFFVMVRAGTPYTHLLSK